MMTTDYVKKISTPKLDSALAWSGLQRAPSTLTKLLTGASFLLFGAFVGAGLTLWARSPKNRRKLSTALTNGIDKVSTRVRNGMNSAGANDTTDHPLDSAVL